MKKNKDMTKRRSDSEIKADMLNPDEYEIEKDGIRYKFPTVKPLPNPKVFVVCSECGQFLDTGVKHDCKNENPSHGGTMTDRIEIQHPAAIVKLASHMIFIINKKQKDIIMLRQSLKALQDSFGPRLLKNQEKTLKEIEAKIMHYEYQYEATINMLAMIQWVTNCHHDIFKKLKFLLPKYLRCKADWSQKEIDDPSFDECHDIMLGTKEDPDWMPSYNGSLDDKNRFGRRKPESDIVEKIHRHDVDLHAKHEAS